MPLEKRPPYLADLVHRDHPLEPFPAEVGQQKGTLTKRQRGRDWTRKTPLRGSLLRASSQTRSAFCTIRCSMSACKAAMLGGSPMTVDAGSGTGRDDSAGVTDACRLRPRRDLSRTISAGDLGSYENYGNSFFSWIILKITSGVTEQLTLS